MLHLRFYITFYNQKAFINSFCEIRILGVIFGAFQLSSLERRREEAQNRQNPSTPREKCSLFSVAHKYDHE